MPSPELTNTPAADPGSDSVCSGGMHIIINPDTGQAENGGPCDSHPDHANDDSYFKQMSQQAAGPTDTANPAYADNPNLPASPIKLMGTQAAAQLKKKVQGPSDPIKMGTSYNKGLGAGAGYKE